MRSVVLLALAAVLVAPPALAAPAAPPAAGHLVDAATGRPIRDAYVRQTGGVRSVFSGPDGRFELVWESAGAAELTIQAGGYRTLTVGASDLLRGPLRLEALAPFAAAATIAPPVIPDAPLRWRLDADYQAMSTSLQTPGGGQWGGVGLNAVRLGGQARVADWFAQASLGRQQVPVEVAGLSAQENPAFSPEAWEAAALAGRLFGAGPVEWGPGVAYRLWRYDPNNRDVPYSNTPLDFRQTSHSLGLGLQAQGEGLLGLAWEAQARYFPLSLGTADPGDPILALQNGAQASMVLGRTVGPGLTAAIGYRFDRWPAAGVTDQTHYLFGRMTFQTRQGE